MILYELKCSNGHYFEAWFKDSTTYDLQEKRGEVACPICSDISVSKAPMAPAVSTSRKKDKRAHQPVLPMENPTAELAQEFLRAAGKMQKYVEENCDYVGEKFADEARAIHYGEAEERGIYGEATIDEATNLLEEDIPVNRIPWSRRTDS